TADYGRVTAAGGNEARDALPFGEPQQAPKPAPTPQDGAPASDTTVLKGRDDWLFLEAELAHACTPYIVWSEAMKRYDRLLQIIRDSGREVVFAIPPDKSTIYGDYMPKSGFAEKDCFAAGRKTTWAELE